ncbi:MAG: hypothetical protein ABI373_05885 [Flavobacteriales bacterium]
MRLKLDDNERGAFNYLIGGAVIVLLIRGAAWLFEVLGPKLSPDGLAIRLFQHGYVGLNGELAVSDTSSGLSERMVLAVVLAVGVAFLLAFVFATIARARHRRAGRLGMWITRLALLTTLVWSLYAALDLPLKETRIRNSTMQVLDRRPIVGDIPWPFATKERSLHRDSIQRIETVEHAPVHGCDGVVEVDVVFAGGRERISRLTGICPEERMDRLRAGSDASALLDRELH